MTPILISRPIVNKKAKENQVKNLDFLEPSLQVKREHSEKSIAEMRRKNKLFDDMNASNCFVQIQ